MTDSASIAFRSIRSMCSARFSARGAGRLEVVQRGLDDVQRVADLVRDAAGDLAQRGQPLAVPEAGGVLGLVGVLDLGQVEVHELVERPDRRDEAVAIAGPGLAQVPDQAVAEPRERDVGIHLFEADLGVPGPDPPASGGIVAIVGAAEEVAEPSQQRALEAIDLGLPAGEDPVGRGVARDLGVEVLHQVGEVRPEQRQQAADPLGVLVAPADVGLEVLVATEDLLRIIHGSCFQRTMRRVVGASR